MRKRYVSPSKTESLLSEAASHEEDYRSFTIKLYDKNQDVMASGKSKNNKIGLDTKSLPKGAYFLHIYYKDAITTKQIMIE